jgi:hypothetical protein
VKLKWFVIAKSSLQGALTSSSSPKKAGASDGVDSAEYGGAVFLDTAVMRLAGIHTSGVAVIATISSRLPRGHSLSQTAKYRFHSRSLSPTTFMVNF